MNKPSVQTPAALAPVPGSAPVVLVVEDDPGDARLIQWQLLEQHPHEFELHLVGSMAAAREQIDSHSLRPDVVLLDLNLPDSSGVATVERCRELLDDVPVVVLTGLDDDAATQAAIQAGAEDYLSKSVQGAALRKAVHYAILRHRRDADARLAATVFAHAREGILVTDPNGVIIEVNDTFTSITGYSRSESIGNKPNLLKSGLHPPEFYHTMWQDLLGKGHWYGEVWNRHKTGAVYAEMLTISTVNTARGKLRHLVGLFSDITQQKAHQKQLEHIAHYDTLTQLPNRVLLTDRIHLAMIQALRRSKQLGVAYIDLDGFKAINDQHGHGAGDQLLISVATRMKQALRRGDTLARLGGDEFVAVLIDLSDSRDCEPTIARILAAASEPVLIEGQLLQVSASVGLTLYPQTEAIDADQLLRQADQTMYLAKQAGKNRYQIFDAEMDRNVRSHHEQLLSLRRALQAQQFELHFQPKVNMQSGALVGVEALIRWRHPQHGLLLPARFMPLIESHALMVELGEWVIDSALTQIERWQQDGLELPVSVNIAALHLQQPDFTDRLQKLLARHPTVLPKLLELEVLETNAMQDMPQVSKTMLACIAMGVGFALDDFGTGYSSLTYLKRLPANMLKIDQSFVRDMLDDPDDLAILQGVLGLATAFHRQVVAEGVEHRAHGELLLRLGCQLAQGYGIARPMPAAELPAWIARWRPDPSWQNARPVNRDDLPLLFAGVEHRAWVAAIEASLQNPDAAVPALHVSDCGLGLWLAGLGSSRVDTDPVLQQLDHLHRQVHAVALELLALRGQAPRSAQALTLLTELQTLRDALTARLLDLLSTTARASD